MDRAVRSMVTSRGRGHPHRAPPSVPHDARATLATSIGLGGGRHVCCWGFPHVMDPLPSKFAEDK